MCVKQNYQSQQHLRWSVSVFFCPFSAFLYVWILKILGLKILNIICILCAKSLCKQMHTPFQHNIFSRSTTQNDHKTTVNPSNTARGGKVQ